MKIKFALLFFFSVILILIVSRTSDSIARANAATESGSVTDVKERIRRVENGLLLPVVKGQPSEPMKLTDLAIGLRITRFRAVTRLGEHLPSCGRKTLKFFTVF